MAFVLAVQIPKRSLPLANLDLGLSEGRWAFPLKPSFPDAEEVRPGDLVFFGVGGDPRGGGRLAGWHARALAEAHLARVVSRPYTNEVPFWIDERMDGSIRWNPTIDIEFIAQFGAIPLAPGVELSEEATAALYRAGVSRQVSRVPVAGSPLLEPHATTPLASPEPPGGVRFVALEKRRSRKALVKARAAGFADPAESGLVHAYADHLRARGGRVGRDKIPLPGGGHIYADLVDQSHDLLVEGKRDATRASIRMAIGQLIDYGRSCKHRRRAVLVPERPCDDLIELLREAGIGAVWPDGEGFADSAGGAFTEPAT